MMLFPMFLRLEHRPCLVVGAGRIAGDKIDSLLISGARVHVVAPDTKPPVDEWILEHKVTWRRGGFEPSDLDGKFLVIDATPAEELHAVIFEEASRRGVLCNIVDDPNRCDFHFPAIVRRGDLQLAISTGGQSPALAQRLRRELEAQFGPSYEDWISQLGEARRRLMSIPMDPEQRKALLHRLAGPEAYQAFVSSVGRASSKGGFL
ncbi:MAG: bifunctional precorrin-2 dehydrogenase/sirohydrochlorin ferrochelatase [Acidobacteria bacterium]|nr:bifunctional precorrin-2 dehydrogenase/sirohydrochlorin ferrochelatase [Acidobacteriota bacterium]